jgi:hypothetical protein
MLVSKFTKDCSSQLIWWKHAKQHPLNEQLYEVHFLVDSAQPYAKAMAGLALFFG